VTETKIHTTNYKNTLIEVASDCPAKAGQTPLTKGTLKSVANIQFELISQYPYRFTSDDVLFEVHAQRNQLIKKEYTEARANFFSKGQPCLRASPLAKRYGWGIHHNEESKIALLGVETAEYQEMMKDESIKKVKAMRSKRA